MFGRRSITALLVVATVLALVLAGARATATVKAPAHATEAIVAVRPGTEVAVRRELERRGLRVLRASQRGTGLLVAIPEGRDIASLERETCDIPGVERVAPNGRIVPLWTPNDPLYGSQWALPDVQMPDAWDVHRDAAGITVAVIDTGVARAHPDLSAAIDAARARDFTTTTGEYPEDRLGHGTHVAGIIGAVTNNGVGVAGVAPGVRILPLKVIGEGVSGSTYDLAEAIRYAADLGAHVINMSLGTVLDTSSPEDSDEAAVIQAAVDDARARGCVLVGAVGNTGRRGVYFPAACDGVIAVAATTRSRTVATYSSFGPEVDLAAPGGDASAFILSTYTDPTYYWMAGTSMAAPHVAGVAALLLAREPAATAGEIEDVLTGTALDIGATGWDEYSGWGLIQVRAALDALDALAISRPQVRRIGGADRYETAMRISRDTFASGDASVAVLASGETFPDALAASGLAGAYRAPLLLTRRASLPSGLVAEFERLGVRTVVIVGGTGAVSRDAETSLRLAGLGVERIGGADRYETAARVAERIRTLRGGATPLALVARGDTFPDALALAPAAYETSSPVLLTRPDALSPAAASALRSLAPDRVIVAGGPGAITPSTFEALAVSGATRIDRWYGVDRYATAAEVASRTLAEGFATSVRFGVASGRSFPDALAGGVAVGARGGVLTITEPERLSWQARDVIDAHGFNGVPVVVFGGTGAISDVVELELRGIRY